MKKNCDFYMDIFFALDKNERLPLSLTAHLLFCRKCRTKAWDDMGWNVITINGHNMPEILSALETAKEYRGKPTCIIANTVKGKGVSFMEHDNSWHQKVPSQAEYEQALRELEEERACL